MQNLLPVVRPEIGACLEHELQKSHKDSVYIKKQLEIIKKENPVISFWIEKFSEKTKDKKGSVFCGLIVFKMLQIQAECDKMKLEIKF